MMSKLIKKFHNKARFLENKLTGKVILEGKNLVEGKDFTVTTEGIKLREDLEKKVLSGNYSYSIYFSQKKVETYNG